MPSRGPVRRRDGRLGCPRRSPRLRQRHRRPADDKPAQVQARRWLLDRHPPLRHRAKAQALLFARREG